VNREDIIRMAMEAGICTGNSILLPAPDGQVEALERFAALAAEWGAKQEREACAKVCEEVGNRDAITNAWDAVDAIRSRGEAKP
jgi:hypothetical protein